MGAGPDKLRGQSAVKGIVRSVEPGGAVMVTLPTLSGDAFKHRARLDPALLRPRSGVAWVPEPGDEVLVAFEHADLRRPYVTGLLWDSGSGAPPETSGSDTRRTTGNSTRPKLPASFTPPHRPHKR